MAEYVIGLPDGAEYTIASEAELSPDELNAEVAAIQKRHSETAQSTTTSAFSAAGRGFIGGAGALVEGIGDVAALVPGLENNDFQEAGQAVKDFGSQSFPVNPANEGRFAVKAGEVVGGVLEQALEYATGAKLLGAGAQASRAAQLLAKTRIDRAATASMLGKGADSGEDMAIQYGMEDDPWKKAAFTLGGGIIEAGTERLGGFAAEGALARRLGILPNGQAGASGYLTSVATEAGEEVAANTANNAMANLLVTPEQAAAAGQRLPGYLEGNLEAGALGAIGGGVMSLPLLGATPADQLPPPAGFTASPSASPPGTTSAPATMAPSGRASAVRIPTPAAGPAGLTEAEIADLENTGLPADSVRMPADSVRIDTNPPATVPPARIAVVAGAIAAAPDAAVEAAVVETAAVAARLQSAIPNPVPVLEQAAPVVQSPAPDPVAPGAIVRFSTTDLTGAPLKGAGTVTAINPDGVASVQTSDGVLSVPSARLRVMGAIPQPTAEQAATAKAGKTSARRFSPDPVAYPLVSAIVEAGISPRNPAAQLAAARANRRESLSPAQQTILKKAGGYEDLPKVSEFAGRPKAQDAIRKMFRNGTSNTPDQALQQAAGYAGRDAAEFYGNTAWQEIREELMKLDGDLASANEADERMDAMERQAIEFYAAIEDGEFQIDLSTLEPGDTLIVEGTELVVKRVNRDREGNLQSIEMQDGKRFGRQEVDATTALFVEEFQEEDGAGDILPQSSAPADLGAGAATTSPEAIANPTTPATAINPAPAPEVTADGQRDMLAGRDDEPFNLTAESAKDRANREARELAERNAARKREADDARKAAEAANGNLFLATDGFTGDQFSINDSDSLSSDAARRELQSYINLAIQRAEPVFAALDARRDDSGRSGNFAAIQPESGELVWSIDSIAPDFARVPGGRVLKQAKDHALSVTEEEMLHAAWLANLKDAVLAAEPGLSPDKVYGRIEAEMRRQYQSLRKEAAEAPDLAQFILDAVNAYTIRDVNPSLPRFNSLAALDAYMATSPAFAENALAEMVRMTAQKWRSGITTEEAKQNWWIKLTEWLKGALRRIATAADSIKDGKYGASIKAAAEASLARLEAAEKAVSTARSLPASNSGSFGNIFESLPLPAAETAPDPKPASRFEKWFGFDKRRIQEHKDFEARNAGRRALEVPLFAGIIDDYVPGRPLEQVIGDLTPAQRIALHDRVLSDFFRITSTEQEAGRFADELKQYLEGVPELEGQRNVSHAGLQFTNMVQVAAALSGIHGMTAAFSTIINTDNDQIKLGASTAILSRADYGRLLASQSGIGSRIAEFARIISETNDVGLKRLGLTDEQIAALSKSVANRDLTANEVEALFAESTTSPQGPDIAGTIAKLQRFVDAAAAKAKPQESEIETLWRLMQEARGTKRGAAIAAALKAFMPDGPRDLSRANQAVLADFRTRMQTQGGENLARSFWQLMSNTPRPAPGSLAAFDSATQSMLGDLLRRAVEKAGLSGETTSIQPDAIDKLVMNLSRDNLRWDKIAAADESVRAEIDAIEDDAKREALRAAWEDATSSMSFAIGGPALMRRALRDQMKDSPPNWKAAFDTGKPMLEAISMDRVTFVNAAMVKIDNALTSEEARANIPALRKEMEATFNDIAAERYAGWLQGRERIAAQQKTAAARKAFMAALQNRGVAEARLAKLAEALSDTPSNARPSAVNPITALINAQMKEAAPDFVERMAELGVTADVAGPLASLIEENRRRAASIDAVTGKPAKLAESILSKAIGPLVAKLPVGSIVKAFMAAPAHHRNSAAWRNQQIVNWLTNNGIDSALASRLSVNMDEMAAAVMANVIYQEQERYVTNQKGVGSQAIANSEFARKFRDNREKIREAIEKGLLTDGTPWQAWFSSVTGIQPLSAADQSQIATWETILSGDRYFPAEKGVAAAKLRDFMNEKFGKDVSGWELLAASYDASALSSGTTMAIQFTGPVGRLTAAVAADALTMLYRPSATGDVMDSFIAAVETYMAEIPLAFKYDTGGNFMGDSAMKVGEVATLKRDMAKQRNIYKDKTASAPQRMLARLRFIRSMQDYLRQAMNAADSAAVAGFKRYFETREIRRIMRANNLSVNEVAGLMEAGNFTTDNFETQADALGYTGPLKRRFVQDAMNAHWQQLVAEKTPEKFQQRIASLAEDAENEGDFQAFVGSRRDSPTIRDPADWLLGGIQAGGERLFALARELNEKDKFGGNAARIALRMGLGFVGIPLNAARAALWYSPTSLFAWNNYRLYKKSLKEMDPTKRRPNPYERSMDSAIQVRQRMKETLIGNTLLLVAIAALKELEDDDEGWQLNGWGPDATKYPEEARAWRRLHVPFSLEKIDKGGNATNIPFQRGTLEPLKAPLMLLAGASDARLNSKLAKEPEPETEKIIWGAVSQLGLSSMTTGMRNLGGMRDVLQRGMNADKVGSQAAFSVSPLMPFAGAERWVRTWAHPEKLEAGFVSNLPTAHYWDSSRPALNMFGQKLYADPSVSEAASKQFSGMPPVYFRELKADDQRLYQWMQRTGKQPTTYGRKDLDRRLDRATTDEEWYNYTEASGKMRYTQMLAAIDGTLPIERNVKVPGPLPDRKKLGAMKKGLADINPSDNAAMAEAGAILQDIGQAAHDAGLQAIGAMEPEKEKAAKKKAAPIY